MHIIAAKEEYKKRGKERRECDIIVIPVLTKKDTVGKNNRHDFLRDYLVWKLIQMLERKGLASIKQKMKRLS